jgi:hypothetical protein
VKGFGLRAPGFALAFAAAGFVVSAHAGSAPDPSSSSGRVHFDHARHAPYAPDCSACHRLAAEERMPGAAVPGRQFDRPVEADCTACHPFERPSPAERVGVADPEVCGLCHPLDDAGRIALPALAPRFPALDFDHRDHAAAAPAATCVACHDAEQLASGRSPAMPRCMTCHADALDGGCARCHLHDERGRLVVDRPGHAPLRPAEWMGDLAHVPGFGESHGVVARTRRDACDSCHEETFCEGCHLGSAIEQRMHPAGWLSLHGAAGRSVDLDCETCHRGQEMCLACHRRAGAAEDSPELGRAVPRGLSFHPAGWSGNPEEHAREARRDLGSCVSCHTGRDCVVCHATVSPHGSGFGSRCAGLRDASSAICLECHATVPDCR